ncbi:MAG: DNA polymerase III subunit gamma/tau [Oscillospiraceae bacterium]|nr:DNA polymerase III subunit gamma/tau [Oscillospiraceae bacterium]
MYQALYRKWRPRAFDDVIGQPQVTETLMRQLEHGRISHAYLFIGTRGTGKTSCAKILAKAVNCEDLRDGNPCNVCGSCVGIDDGSILDVEELDAASNNGVDHVRALRDEAIFTPAVVKKRVYIIDEVHGLSIAAFNALLKILEEPPLHLLFILATTEAHKVPATIASRCQRFRFRRVGATDIVARLRKVADAEGLELQDDAAQLLARLADGSMRDALALLDQCAGGQAITADLVRRFVGLVGSAECANLLRAACDGDVEAALGLVGELYYGGRDMGALLGELSTLLRDILLVRIAPKGSENLLSGSFDRGTIDTFSAMTPERLLGALTQVTDAIADLGRSANRKLAVEICMIRLCDVQLAGDAGALSARVAELEQKIADGVPVAAVGAAPAPVEVVQSVQVPPSEIVDAPPWADTVSQLPRSPAAEELPQSASLTAPSQAKEPMPEPKAASAPSAAPPVSAAGDDIWGKVLASAQKTLDVSVYTLISDGKEVSAVLDGEGLQIYIENAFFLGVVEKKEVLAVLEAAVSEVEGRSVRVKCHAGAPPTAGSSSSKLDALTRKGFDNITIK